MKSPAASDSIAGRRSRLGSARAKRAPPKSWQARGRRQTDNTPAELLPRIAASLGGSIEFDPCSNAASLVEAQTVVVLPRRRPPAHACRVIFGDGTRVPWLDRWYCNPPWEDLRPWFDAAERARAQGHSGVMLVPLRPHRVYWRWSADSVVFLPPVRFVGHANAISLPCVLLYYGQDRRAFMRAWAPTCATFALTRVDSKATIPSMVTNKNWEETDFLGALVSDLTLEAGADKVAAAVSRIARLRNFSVHTVLLALENCLGSDTYEAVLKHLILHLEPSKQSKRGASKKAPVKRTEAKTKAAAPPRKRSSSPAKASKPATPRATAPKKRGRPPKAAPPDGVTAGVSHAGLARKLVGLSSMSGTIVNGKRPSVTVVSDDGKRIDYAQRIEQELLPTDQPLRTSVIAEAFGASKQAIARAFGRLEEQRKVVRHGKGPATYFTSPATAEVAE